LGHPEFLLAQGCSGGPVKGVRDTGQQASVFCSEFSVAFNCFFLNSLSAFGLLFVWLSRASHRSAHNFLCRSAFEQTWSSEWHLVGRF
jgi:hypothetical protein